MTFEILVRACRRLLWTDCRDSRLHMPYVCCVLFDDGMSANGESRSNDGDPENGQCNSRST